ncbi:MAG: DUF2273 domain-containing protein [Bacillota bacterium]
MENENKTNEVVQEFKQTFAEYKSQILGALIGLIIAILILTIGLAKTLLLTAFTLAGYLIGNREDLNKDFYRVIDYFVGNNR